MIRVEMRDVDVIDLDEAGRVDHLALGALTAVDEDPRTARADQHARGRPPRRGHGAAGAEKDDGEIHDAPSLGRGARPGGRTLPRHTYTWPSRARSSAG